MQQQTVNEQNQMGSQVPVQQMMLCPVRVVYETQILVQAGEQIQPNQTIYINPQNPPPWMQNRPFQNQVVYIQHAPNNIVPSIQQHMDQSQMYLQQAYNQPILQPMIPQSQEIRPYQLANMTHSVQNNQNTIANISNQPNDRIHPTVYTSHPNISQSIPTSTPMQANAVGIKHNFLNVQGVDAMKNLTSPQRNILHMNVGQPMNQQTNTMRQPQMITVNPIQPTNTDPKTFDQTQNVVHNPSLPAYSTTNMPIVNKVEKAPPIYSQTYLYRPIQPRPQYIANIQTMSNPQNQTALRMANIGQSIVQSNTNIRNKTQVHQAVEVKTNINNRKRKSESPDEINKKLIAMNVNMPQNTIDNTKKLQEIGVNTIPVLKHCALNAETPIKKIEELRNKIIAPTSVIIQKAAEKTEDVKIKVEKDKLGDQDPLVRHTVFTQARGLNIKEGMVKVNTNVLRDTKNIINEQGAELKVDNIVKIENAKEIKEKVNTRDTVDNNDASKNNMKELNKSISDLKNKGMVFASNAKSQDKDYVLTHVLEGIVIQESNTAFPIREPIKRLYANPKVIEIGREEVRIGCEKINAPSAQRNEEEKLEESTKGDPFAKLKPANVKSWTVDKLVSHLAKYKWDETISALQEHEIDGESLFLVNRSQLVKIGVHEEHADIICNYVKSC
ncbi:uncharacterized protein LOC113513834 isoform X2 [Galleria mellonella]|uniref:Uncharacterized protein LOC113513834 isoform X2 n=1 Tax=Galleria mellonella TaxID=7137 RepID=A0A6J1WP59_GALME|nr:uncharacterized protein LOC113513834 isoform X2 [Galleria mellonella]